MLCFVCFSVFAVAFNAKMKYTYEHTRMHVSAARYHFSRAFLVECVCIIGSLCVILCMLLGVVVVNVFVNKNVGICCYWKKSSCVYV